MTGGGGWTRLAPEQQLQLEAHEGISLLAKTIVGKSCKRGGEEERIKPFECVRVGDLGAVVWSVWPGMSVGSHPSHPPITLLVQLSLA